MLSLLLPSFFDIPPSYLDPDDDHWENKRGKMMADLTADVLVVRPIYGICNRQGKQLFADVSGTSFRIELLFVIDNARWYA
jgi:hypothetical protein